MLEGQYRTANQGLAKLVTEVGSTIRSLDQNLLRCLIEPLANGQNVLPVAILVLNTRIGSHIDGSTCDRP